MVLIGFVEAAEGLELDGGFLAGLFLERSQNFLNHFPIIIVIVIYAGAVSCAFVLTLFVQAERVDHLQEQAHELFQRDILGIITDVDAFGVTGLVSIDLFVGRVDFPTVREADFREDYSVHEFEELLRSPEASGGEPDVSFLAVEQGGHLLKILPVNFIECVQFLTVDVKDGGYPATFPARYNNLAAALA